MNYTIGYLCYIAHQKNVDVKLKTELLEEAKTWKIAKHLGRVDVCFELYNEMKYKTQTQTAHIKEVAKYLRAKVVYASDYSIMGIVVKVGKYYNPFALNPTQLEILAEQYLIECVILGGSGDLQAISDSKR